MSNGNKQEAWRPKQVFHTVQDRYIKPDFVVDITDFHDQKIEAIRAFKSQFFNPDYDENSNEPQSYISSPEFLEFRHRPRPGNGTCDRCEIWRRFYYNQNVGGSGFVFVYIIIFCHEYTNATRMIVRNSQHIVCCSMARISLK